MTASDVACPAEVPDIGGESLLIVKGDHATRAALQAVALPFVPFSVTDNESEAAAVASAGGTFALKLISDTVVHKSDLGLVKLDVPAVDVPAVYRCLAAAARELGIQDGQVVVQPMVPDGIDLFVGCSRDDVLGPVVLVGLGGVTVELFEDVARRLPPITPSDARQMLQSLASYPLLQGYRGSPSFPSAEFESIVSRVAEFVASAPELLELDLNPVRVFEDGTVMVLDARSTWRHPDAAESFRHETRESRDLTPLFTPRTVAVVGASRDGNRPGGRMVEAIVAGGFTDPIYPINPAAAVVAGVPSWPDLEALPGVPDLVCVALPAETTKPIVEKCVALGVPAVMLMASGYGEVGPDGARREAELEEAVRGSRTMLCGPNTIGFANPSGRLVATFSRGMSGVPGADNGVCVVAQSGAVVGSLVSREIAQGYGIGTWVTVGNQLDLDMADYLDHLSGQPSTRAIALFLEGVKDGDRLRRALQRARARGVPLVAFKSGLTNEGGRAVTAHSGALAGSGEAYQAMFAQEQVVRVGEITALLETAWVLAHHATPQSSRISVVTTSGGAGGATVDLIVQAGLSLADAEPVAGELRDVLPSLAQVGNPLDVTAEGAFQPGVVRDSLTLLARTADVLCVVLTSIVGAEAVRVAREISDASQAVGKPVVVTWLVDRSLAEGGMRLLAEHGVRVFDEPARMVDAVRALVTAGRRSDEADHLREREGGRS
jgi:acyl-CoA synthetase (NDP forming)